MNYLALLAIFFGITTALLLCILCAMAHSHREWRLLATRLAETGREFIKHCNALEARNAYLESQADHNRALTAAAMLYTRRYLGAPNERLVIVEREAP